MNLGADAWPDVVSGSLVLIPLGSTEQHGPHLPLETDTAIARAVAFGASARLNEHERVTCVAPAVPYGSSGEHHGFPGTFSIGTEVLERVVVELVRSIADWAGQIVFVNGHGGNVDALIRSVRTLRREGHDTAWVPCAAAGSDPHAGFTETSLMLHLHPATVRTERIRVGNRTSLKELLPTLRDKGIRAVTADGVLGDPRTANALDGRSIYRSLVDDIVARIKGRHIGPYGCMEIRAEKE